MVRLDAWSNDAQEIRHCTRSSSPGLPGKRAETHFLSTVSLIAHESVETGALDDEDALWELMREAKLDDASDVHGCPGRLDPATYD